MTEQEQMNELIDKVYQWGIDRKIIGNGKLETQWLKLLSEFGEMCDTLAKGGDPIDDIGDQLVVLIMMAGIVGRIDHAKRAIFSPFSPEEAAEEESETLCALMCKTYSTTLDSNLNLFRVYHLATGTLSGIASHSGHTLKECLSHAWNEIKDRKGYLNEQGLFIKE